MSKKTKKNVKKMEQKETEVREETSAPLQDKEKKEPEETKGMEIDIQEIKKFAQKNGLLSLNLVELEALAKSYGLKESGKKKEIAQRIVNSKDNAKLFVLGEPIGNMQIKRSVLGFKRMNVYPIDKEREQFFLKTKVFK